MLSSVNSCAVCSTHLRPADVPWHQHVVGCPVRTGCLAPAADVARNSVVLAQPHRGVLARLTRAA
jgi:hypothetical protein